MLSEEEISDVSLGTFYVFDKENAGKSGEQYAQRGCGGCRGCRGCRGCARLRLLYLAGVLPHLLNFRSFLKCKPRLTEGLLLQVPGKKGRGPVRQKLHLSSCANS